MKPHGYKVKISFDDTLTSKTISRQINSIKRFMTVFLNRLVLNVSLYR
jgi:hypothetical protein